jgi:hypothetical protein
LCLYGFTAQATLEIGASVQIHARSEFEAPLAAHGSWVQLRSYGRGWHPARVALDWRPYCDGQWVWTDCGWYWQSDEPWAWACYHYGRWLWGPEFGWVWVPDLEWAPAWVYWRSGGGYIGWAPCPPAGVTIEPRFFAFVQIARFDERVRPRTVIVNDTKIINQTTVIKNIRHETRNIEGDSRKVVINEGPGVDLIRKAGHRNINAVPIQEAARRTSAPSSLMAKQGQSPSHEKSPAFLPNQERAPGLNSRPPANEIAPKAPPSADRAAPPEERDAGGRVIPPGGSAHPLAGPSPRPEGPVGKSDHGERKDKDQGHDKNEL